MSDTLVRPRQAPIDPRLRQRRIEVARARGRRRLRILIRALAAACLMALVVGLALSPLFQVRHVRVDGLPGYLEADVAGEAAHMRGQPLVLADAGGLRARLLADPRLAAVRVTKEPPGTIRITAARRIPVAAAAVADGYVLLAADGIVIQGVGEAPGSLPALYVVGVPASPGSRAEPALPALKILQQLPLPVLARLRELRLGPDGTLVLQLDGGALVLFGPAEVDTFRKAQVLEALLAKATSAGWVVKAYNLTSPETPAVIHGSEKEPGNP